MSCNGNCFSNYNKDEDDFVIQRLQDIITICEFLIKHEKNSNSKKTLKEMLDNITSENDKKKNREEDNTYYINKYNMTNPWIKPYYYYSWWDHIT